MLTRKALIAIDVCYQLERYRRLEEHTPLKAKDLAEMVGATEQFTSTILQQLGAMKLVRSVRGKKGGYLSNPPRQTSITELDVAVALGESDVTILPVNRVADKITSVIQEKVVKELIESNRQILRARVIHAPPREESNDL